MSRVLPKQAGRSNANLVGRIKIVKGALEKQEGVDAIMTAIQANMDVSGSLNESIIKAAGEEFDQYILEQMFRPRAGDVLSVPGFELDAEYVIVTVTPSWKIDFEMNDRHLRQCYRAAMEEAIREGYRKIALPLIGTGSKINFPPKRAARIAINGVLDRLNYQIEEVRLVSNNDDHYKLLTDRLSFEKKRLKEMG